VKDLLIPLVVAAGGIPWPVSYYPPGKDVCSEPPPDSARTILGIRVQKQAVQFAQRILGPSPLRSQGHDGGGEHVTWRCWEAASGDGTVLYVSRGDVEGNADAGMTVWSPFPPDTKYFDPSPSPFMINFRVANLNALLAQLSSEGVRIDPRREDYDYGRFAWIYDPEGNKIELWEPLKPL